MTARKPVDAAEGAPCSQVHLEAHQRPGGPLLLLTLDGDLDLASAEELVRVPHDLLDAHRTTHGDLTGVAVIVDAAGVTFIDCAGLRALMELWRLTTSGRGSFSLIRTRPETVRLLRMTGTDHVIPVCRDLAEAIDNDHRPPAG